MAEPLLSSLDAVDEAAEALKNTQSYQHLISSLPKNDSEIFPQVQYQGFWMPNFAWALALRDHFHALPADVVLATHPKSGTTWLKALAFAVLNRDRCSPDRHPLLTSNPHDCVPVMDLRDGRKQVLDPDQTRPRLMATHYPYPLLPPSVHNSCCRIIYLCRDPKDVLVSLFHLVNRIAPRPLSQMFDMFCSGKSLRGPFWDHCLSYWKESRERPETVLFFKYEEMMEEPVGSVKRLAEFIGCPFSEEEERSGAVEEVLRLCSFEKLSSLEANKVGSITIARRFTVECSSFFRKGEVGDWKTHLTPEMAERLDDIVEQKLEGSGLTFRRDAHCT